VGKETLETSHINSRRSKRHTAEQIIAKPHEAEIERPERLHAHLKVSSEIRQPRAGSYRVERVVGS
jgi:hypothetical protein